MDGKKHNRDFLSITEFAEIAGMTAEALRHYDRTGVFHPVETGNSKQRHYDPTQITTINIINMLTEAGVSLETIAELAKQRTPEDIMKLINKKKSTIADKKRSLATIQSILCTFLDQMIEGVCAIENEMIVSEMPEKRLMLGDPNDYSDTEDLFKAFIQFCRKQKERGYSLSYPIGGLFDSMDAFMSDPSRPNRFFTIDPSGTDCREKGLYLIGYTRGYYGQLGDLPKRMGEYAKAKGLTFTGPVFNIYLLDELCIVDKNQYLLQAAVPVNEAHHIQNHRHMRY